MKGQLPTARKDLISTQIKPGDLDPKPDLVMYVLASKENSNKSSKF